jgi:catechol 2,3-dioxygenase-like lactoylglutathione lyase family enzyme
MTSTTKPTPGDTTNKETGMSQFPGITHIALTVTDLPRSTAWYAALFGSSPVLDEDVEAGGFHHTVFAVGGGHLLGLHKHQDEVGTPFDARSPGLDHVAFSCADRTELEKWGNRLDELGVSHGGIIDAHYGSGLAFRDPDGIALEFFAPPS